MKVSKVEPAVVLKATFGLTIPWKLIAHYCHCTPQRLQQVCNSPNCSEAWRRRIRQALKDLGVEIAATIERI